MAEFKVRGVIEGFYGNPWTHQQRLEMIRFLHDHGFNAFIYGPKDDPYHRDKWREPYPEDAWKQLAETVRRADELHVDFCYAISPGLSLRYSDGGEVDTLIAKCTPILGLGVRTLGVFLDDISFDLAHEEDKTRYKSLVEAQVDFLQRLYTRLQTAEPGLRLIMCPTVYCGDPDVEYIRYLGANLPSEIDIFWTGPAICSHELTTAYTRKVAEVMKRPPLYWDNYPVNDAVMTAELHIGPYLNRDSDLYTAARGLYANPMEFAEASKVPLATVGAYLTDPAGYDPQTIWRRAAEEIAGKELADALGVFAESATYSCLMPDDPPVLVDLLRRVRELAGAFQGREAAELLLEAASRMQAASDKLVGAADRLPLVKEMMPWLNEYREWCVLLLEVAELSARRRTPTPEGDAEARRRARREARAKVRENVREGLKKAVEFRTNICGHAVRNFLQEFLWRTA
jgi:hyaluronoglucosaminidase